MKNYSVFMGRFHGGKLLTETNSLNQAVKVARKYDCSKNGCQCGGPHIIRNEDGANYYNWNAAKPFYPANEPFWETGE